MATTNRLAAETSPYLLQHAHNPVDWYAWGEEAFRAAREADKPILLSVGYSACHWCHVMAHESFESEAVAKLMNDSFVNIKVDREERPDVDQLYQGVVQLMGRGGGWPLTVFLTPDLRPFFGGTYFPPEDRYGMPGFARLLQSVGEAWRTRRGELLDSAADFQRGLRDLMAYGIGEGRAEVEVADIARAGERLAQEIDFENGGFGGAPKFPNPMSLALMLRANRRGADPEALAGALLTLDRMAQGGIYDQLGGGFHRYSVDAFWAVPHFEKMLYDNAQLVHLYTEGWQLTRSPLYARVVEETVAYVQREMTSPEGGFYSSQDADSEGEEGRFFVFDPAEVESAVGAGRAALMCEHFGVDEQGNFEHGRTVLSVSKTATELAEASGRPEADIERELAEGRRAMFLAREARPRPGRDDKILAGWNGLMIRGLAFAGRAFGRPDWIALASRAADFVLGKMLRGRDLSRSYKDGRARIDGLLEDYGNLVEGLAVLYSATFEAGYLQAAVALADTALERFRDDASGAFLASPKTGEQLVAPVFSLHDNAWPAGASTLADGLVLLAGLTSRGEYLDAAGSYLGSVRDQMMRAPAGFGHLLCAADAWLDGAATLVVAGNADDALPMLADAARRYAPTVAVTWSDPAREPPPIVAATVEGKRPLHGKATAYLCRNFACEAPSASADVLDALGSAPAAP